MTLKKASIRNPRGSINLIWKFGSDFAGLETVDMILWIDEIHFAPRNETMFETITIVGIYSEHIRNQAFLYRWCEKRISQPSTVWVGSHVQPLWRSSNS